MTIVVRVASIAGAGAALVVAALFQHVGAPPDVSQFWPVTFVGWIGSISGILAFGGFIVHQVRNPSERVKQESTEARAALAKDLNEHIAQVERQLAGMERATDARVVDYRVQLERWDTRVRDVEREVTIMQTEMRHVSTGQGEIKETLEEWHRESQTYNLKILDAMARIAGGVRGMRPEELHHG